MVSRLVKYNRDNPQEDRLKTLFTPVEPYLRYAHRIFGDSYSLPFFEISPTAADDLIIYLKNTAKVMLEVFRVSIVSTVSNIVVLKKVTGPAGGGGATIVPVHKTLSEGKTYGSNISALSDPDITGLTEVGTLDTYGLLASAGQTFDYPEGIRLNIDDALALGVGDATAVVSGSIHFMVHPEDE